MKILFAPDVPAGGGAAAVLDAPAAKPVQETPTPPSGDKPDAPKGDMWDDLDREIGDKKPAPKVEKPADKPADKPTEKVEDKKPEEKPADKPILTGPKALREQLEKVNTEKANVIKERDELRSKVKTLESKNGDSTKLSEHIAKVEKERDDLAKQLRAKSREASPEFKEKYDKPFKQAAGYAQNLVESLEVSEPDPEGGEPKRRPGTLDDLKRLFNLPLKEGFRLARQMFGDDANVVTQELSKLHQMTVARDEALKDENRKWDEEEAAAVKRKSAEAEVVQATWNKVNEDLLGKHPEWGESADDKELNDIRAKGYSLVDQRYSSENWDKLTIQEKIVVDANIMHRAANYPRLQLELSRAKQELAARDAKIAEMQEAGVGKVRKATSDNGSSKPKGWAEELDEELG